MKLVKTHGSMVLLSMIKKKNQNSEFFLEVALNVAQDMEEKKKCSVNNYDYRLNCVRQTNSSIQGGEDKTGPFL